MATATTDFRLQPEGSIVILYPTTDEAVGWVAEHIDPEAQRWCGGVVVETSYLAPILEGINEEGLTWA